MVVWEGLLNIRWQDFGGQGTLHLSTLGFRIRDREFRGLGRAVVMNDEGFVNLTVKAIETYFDGQGDGNI